MSISQVNAYTAGNPVTGSDPLGLCPPNGGCPPDLILPNDELVRDAALAALFLITPNQNEGNNIAPLTDNFAAINSLVAIDTSQFHQSISIHSTHPIEADIPGYPSYVAKIYNDPDLWKCNCRG